MKYLMEHIPNEIRHMIFDHVASSSPSTFKFDGSMSFVTAFRGLSRTYSFVRAKFAQANSPLFINHFTRSNRLALSTADDLGIHAIKSVILEMR